MALLFWNDKIHIRRIAFKKARIMLAVHVDSQPSKSAKLNLLLTRRFDQTIHFQNKIGHCINEDSLCSSFFHEERGARIIYFTRPVFPRELCRGQCLVACER